MPWYLLYSILPQGLNRPNIYFGKLDTHEELSSNWNGITLKIIRFTFKAVSLWSCLWIQDTHINTEQPWWCRLCTETSFLSPVNCIHIEWNTLWKALSAEDTLIFSVHCLYMAFSLVSLMDAVSCLEKAFVWERHREKRDPGIKSSGREENSFFSWILSADM